MKKCNENKTETEFKPDPRNSTGLQGICKACNHKYYLNMINREKLNVCHSKPACWEVFFRITAGLAVSAIVILGMNSLISYISSYSYYQSSKECLVGAQISFINSSDIRKHLQLETASLEGYSTLKAMYEAQCNSLKN